MTTLKAMASDACPIRGVRVNAYRVPTDGPESDGTFEWDATTLILVEIEGGGQTGIGYTYADTATATLVRDLLRDVVIGQSALQTGLLWNLMMGAVRNLGRGGIAAMAISAMDVALWDLRAKLLQVRVCDLLGPVRSAVNLYGSGGFTSYSPDRLCEQLGAWVSAGIPRVKMKIGRDPEHDPARVETVRKAIGPAAELFVDANGAYQRKQAVAIAEMIAASGVTWYEEPVYHLDFEGLARVREAVPAQIEVASGEYGYDLPHFARMLEADAVDVLQADATRCGGFSALLAVDGLAQAHHIPLSTHCAPHLHLHAAMACKQLRHMEYFYDHVRIERRFFDGIADPETGTLAPSRSRPGIGLEFKWADAEPFAI
jgi:L-alanine-DL-glutamate epimerase-like enolase superfamily enzyme